MKFLKDKGIEFIHLSKAENDRLNQDAMEVFEERADDLKKKGHEAEVNSIQTTLKQFVSEYNKTH